jgi:hypothetical protein
VESALRSGVEMDFRLRLLDADGFTVSLSPSRSWYAGVTLEPGDNDLDPFDLPLATDRVPLGVALWWADSAGSTPAWVHCAEAGVARVGYRLEDGAGAVVDEVPLDGSPLACPGLLSWPGVAPDTYTLIVEGEDEAGERAWRAECWGLEAIDPEDNTFVCNVPRVP